jgi:hypothetical protein
MIAPGTTIFGPEIPSAGPVFTVALALHILAGITAVTTGAVALSVRKAPGRYPRFGTVYIRCLAVVFVTATIMTALRWAENWYLFLIGALAFSAATAGYLARRRRWCGWLSLHIPGMSLSSVGMLTAFSIDNGPQLPLWNRLPAIAFWVGPSLIGVPLVLRALARHRPRSRTDAAAVPLSRGGDRAPGPSPILGDSR